MRDWIVGKCHRGTVQEVIKKTEQKQKDRESHRFENKILNKLQSDSANFQAKSYDVASDHSDD